MTARFLFGMILKFLSLALETLAIWVTFGGKKLEGEPGIADFHVPVQREVAQA